MQAMTMLGCVALLSAAGAFAGPAPASVTASPPPSATVKPLTAQQERMKTCNAEAGARGLKGSARKSFMSACLKSG